MTRRATLLVIAAVALVGAAVGLTIRALDDDQPANGAAPPGPGVVACDAPPTVLATFDRRDGLVEVFLVRPGADPAPLTPDIVASGPAVSPDGRRAVVSRAEHDYSSSHPWVALATVDLDGTDLRPLTPLGPTYDESPTWSPDGSSIAFARLDATVDRPVWSVMTISPDGGTPTSLHAETDEEVSLRALAWSPDGARLAFVRGVEPSDGNSMPTYSLWLVDRDGSDARPLADIGEASSLDWSPDGTRILVGDRGPEPAPRIVDVATGRVASLDAALAGVRWSTRPGRVVGWRRPDGALVEQVLDGTRMGETDVLLTREELPPSDWDDAAPASSWDETAVVPCGT